MFTCYTTVPCAISFAARPKKIFWVLSSIAPWIHRPMNILVPVGESLLTHLHFTFPCKQNEHCIRGDYIRTAHLDGKRKKMRPERHWGHILHDNSHTFPIEVQLSGFVAVMSAIPWKALPLLWYLFPQVELIAGASAIRISWRLLCKVEPVSRNSTWFLSRCPQTLFRCHQHRSVYLDFLNQNQRAMWGLSPRLAFRYELSVVTWNAQVSKRSWSTLGRRTTISSAFRSEIPF